MYRFNANNPPFLKRPNPLCIKGLGVFCLGIKVIERRINAFFVELIEVTEQVNERRSGGSKMTKDKLKGLVNLGSLITAIGFILIFFSVNFGESVAGNWLGKLGRADPSTYQVVFEGSVNNFLASGSILFGIGLATLIFVTRYLISTNRSNKIVFLIQLTGDLV